MAAGPEVVVSDLANDCHDALWELLDLFSALHCEVHDHFGQNCTRVKLDLLEDLSGGQN